MKFIADRETLSRDLLACVDRYAHFDWAVAWAGIDFPGFAALKKHRRKARRVIVGTQFYQTHPEFIEAFVDEPAFRFVYQPSGVFHPKLYYFENSGADWACVVGSPNFTNSAFEVNAEAAVYFDSEEPNARELRDQIQRSITQYWEADRIVTSTSLPNYWRRWKQNKPRRKHLSDDFTDRPAKKAFVETSLFSYDWPHFFEAVGNDRHHDFDKRLAVLRSVAEYFSGDRPFHKFSKVERQQVAGIADDDYIPWRYFGSMRNAGQFQEAIADNNPHISEALDQIPLSGEVREDDYDAFIREFQKAFPDGGDGLGTATRLLAMKRPDVFLCVDGPNIDNLAEDIGIPVYRITSSKNKYGTYWPEVIARIQETTWWQARPPREATKRAVWDGRAALLDAIYYEPRNRKR